MSSTAAKESTYPATRKINLEKQLTADLTRNQLKHAHKTMDWI